MEWKVRNLIFAFYREQTVLVRTNFGDTEPGELGSGVRQGCCVSSTLFNIYAEAMVREALEDSGKGIKVRGQNIKSIRFADDKAIISNNEKDLQHLVSSLEKTAIKYGMKINVGKTKVMNIAKISKPITIKVEGKILDQVKQFRYLGSLIEEDGRCDKEIKARIVMGKHSFYRRKTLYKQNGYRFEKETHKMLCLECGTICGRNKDLEKGKY